MPVNNHFESGLSKYLCFKSFMAHICPHPASLEFFSIPHQQKRNSEIPKQNQVTWHKCFPMNLLALNFDSNSIIFYLIFLVWQLSFLDCRVVRWHRKQHLVQGENRTLKTNPWFRWVTKNPNFWKKFIHWGAQRITFSHCQHDCIRIANLVLHQKENLTLCQTSLKLHIPPMTFYLARFTLCLAC